tara:strand:- start:1008 stop:1283 length:276 start_codon:yes stop_codon:yes gene_type:complete
MTDLPNKTTEGAGTQQPEGSASAAAAPHQQPSAPPVGFFGPICVLENTAYKVGERVQYQGWILYCAPQGCWIDYGPADPIPIWARDGSGGN